jgi:hypothetical protein
VVLQPLAMVAAKGAVVENIGRNKREVATMEVMRKKYSC